MKTDQLTIIASNGIKIREYRNLALVPAFYYLPKYDLELCDPWVFQIPRNPHHIIDNPKALELIESDRFIGVLQYLYRHLAWQFLNVGMNIYTASENNPVYVLCSDLNLWLEGFYDYKILPTMQELLCNEEADMEFGYVSLEEFTKTMEFITQYVMMKHGYFGIVDVVKQYRCLEDYNDKDSVSKANFIDRWYHNRTKHPTVYINDIQGTYDDETEEYSDELADPDVKVQDEAEDNIMIERFMSKLNDKDKQILQLRLDNYTYEEIAAKLGYKTHSAMVKRIKRIGESYQKYAKTDLGFG